MRDVYVFLMALAALASLLFGLACIKDKQYIEMGTYFIGALVLAGRAAEASAIFRTDTRVEKLEEEIEGLRKALKSQPPKA